MYDYLFRGATVIDGTGKTAYKANVATKGKLIAYIGDEPVRASHVYDAKGKYLVPGFIDIHAHSEFLALNTHSAKEKLEQGITTDVSGNCGIGVFPYVEGQDEIKNLCADVLGSHEPWSWRGFSSFKEELEKDGLGINMLFLQAHAPLRTAVLKDNPNREATEEEIDEMCALLDESLREGCIGFSSGLYYAPCLFASSHELERLLEVVAKHDALFAVHHRCEGNDIISSVKEVLDLALKTKVRLEISHLKVIGRDNQKKLDTVLSMIEEYREKGCRVQFDQYPYVYGSTSLFSLLPPSALKLSRTELRFALSIESQREEYKNEILNPEGWDSIYAMVGAENITIIELESNREFEGLSLASAAERAGSDPLSTLFDLLAEESGSAVMLDVTESEESLERILKSPHMCFGTDALYSSDNPHPRSRSAAIQLIKRYGLDKKTIPLEEIIRKMSGETASRLKLKDRGLIKECFLADLVLFDPEKLEATAEPGKPFCKNEGLDVVMVSGIPVVEDGLYNGKLRGRVILGSE